MKSKKPLPLLLNVELFDIGHEGVAVGKVDEMVVFVEDAVPGDIVNAQVLKKKKKYMEAKATEIVKPSPFREIPFCEHFGTCGGCKWQHLSYAKQLHFKQHQVEQTLKRISGLHVPELLPILGSKETRFYRNKLEYTFSEKRWLTKEEILQDIDFSSQPALGFHIPGRFDKVLDIRNCYLQPDPSNAIRLEVRNYATSHDLSFFNIKEQHGFLRNLLIRNSTTGELMVVLVVFEDRKEEIHRLLNHLKTTFQAITSLFYIVNTKRNDSISDQEPILFYGNDHILEKMEGLNFKISPKSFYQTNSLQAYELYKVTRTFADIKPHEIVYDLYTGTGTIANFVAHQAKKVVGIEYVEDAIKDALLNSTLNDIKNTSFYAGDIKDVLSNELIEKEGRADVIITDPPRAGMHEDVVKKIIEIRPERIVYVSCNPATQARDLQLMSENYEIKKVQPVDMFPHTYHLENIVLLIRKP